MRVPKRIVKEITSGKSRANDWWDWIKNTAPEDVKEHVQTALRNGLSLEWALLTASADIPPDPRQWDKVRVTRRKNAGWYVNIIVNGEPNFIGRDD